MIAKHKVETLLDELISQGEAILKTQWAQPGNWVMGPPVLVDLRPLSEWRASCKLLSSLLGPAGRCWEKTLTEDFPNRIERAISVLGTLKAIRHAVAEGLLLKVEDLVLAEAFANLFEQAHYLLSQGYALASGVILRALLEERLRRMCEANSLTIPRERPTLNDYNTELYKASAYDKITFKDIDALIAIGNAAAHNDQDLCDAQVSQLCEGVARVLGKFSN